jgi:hypothetical protein
LVRKERIGGLGNANHTRETQKRERSTPTPISQHMRTQHISERGRIGSVKKVQKQSIKGESYPQGTVKENALKRRGISQMYKNKGISEV